MIRRHTTLLYPFLLVLLALGACNPRGNPGDLIVDSNASGMVSSDSMIGSYTALYGIELGHPNPGQSDSTSSRSKLILTLFVLTPEEEAWQFSGSGSIKAPWYKRLSYRQRWVQYPQTSFTRIEKNGSAFEDWESRTFNWEFDGRNRSIRIAGTSYPVSVGGFVIVKFDRRWNPEVGIGEESLETLRISAQTRKVISACLRPLRLGLHGPTSACMGAA